MDTDIIDLDAFKHEQVRLHSLMDDNPAKAIEEARSLPSDTPVKEVLYTGLKAGVLIDAGSSAKDKQAIHEGVALFRRLLSESPKDAALHYNLGNGLAALAEQYARRSCQIQFLADLLTNRACHQGCRW